MAASRFMCALLYAVAAAHSAQSQSALVTVHGIAYDSLRDAPLSNALVAMVGRALTATTDSRGRFHFDSVQAGRHTFVVQHDSLDAVGFTGITTHADVREGLGEVVAALPSCETLWRVACGGKAPKDSGLVYGTVRDASGRAVGAGAIVDVTWLDLAVDSSNDVSQHRWHRTVESESSGSYALCGVPASITVRLRAATDSAASGVIDLPPSELRVYRRDLLVARASDVDTTNRGTVIGQLSNASGEPFADARVLMDDVPEVRSGPTGRFVLLNVPAGTRQIEILSLGMRPVVLPVNVVVRDTVTLAVTLKKVTTLDVMRVTATRRAMHVITQLDERKRAGLGYFRDSTAINRTGSLQGALEGMPSLQLFRQRGGGFVITLPASRGRCVANIWVDGMRQRDVALLDMLRPEEIAVVEIYPRKLLVPNEFAGDTECGVVAVWTKWKLQ
ncbi:MAG: carboxypeptidase-like regulatory domain-containing protein [bacterium]